MLHSLIRTAREVTAAAGGTARSRGAELSAT